VIHHRRIPSTQFRRDLKRIFKRRYRLEKLEKIIDQLAAEEPLPPRCRNHKLTGNWVGHWECHIEPDWLLIYHYDHEGLHLDRSGTHADLFE
jgi:mRNA interferase YafQ